MWLSLVERYVRDVEVAGSNPVKPMNVGKGRNFQHKDIGSADYSVDPIFFTIQIYPLS